MRASRLALVFACALTLRLAFFSPALFTPGAIALADSLSYWEASLTFPPSPLRAPLFPVLLALGRFFTPDPRLVPLAVVFLDSAAAVLVALAARKLGGDGVLGGLLYALMPGVAFYAGALMREGLSSSALALCLFGWLAGRSFLSGLCWGLAGLLRVNLLLPGLVAWGASLRRPHRALVFIAGLLVFPLVAASYNGARRGFFGVSLNSKWVLTTSWVAYGTPGGRKALARDLGLGRKVHPSFLEDAGAAEAAKEYSLKRIMQNAGPYAVAHARGSLWCLLGPPVGRSALRARFRVQETGPAWLIMWLVKLGVLALAFLGLLSGKDPRKWVLLGMILTVVVAAGPTGYGRFLIPLSPALALLGSLARPRAKPGPS